MATVPVMSTVSAGGIGTAALWNSQVRDLGLYLLGRPRGMFRQTVAQSLTNAVFASLTLDVEDTDNDSAHSTSTNTSRYTAATAGYFTVIGCACTAANNTHTRAVRLAVNGAALNGSLVEGAASVEGVTSLLTARLVFLNVGDYAEVQGFQNSGSALNTGVTADGQSWLSVLWEGS